MINQYLPAFLPLRRLILALLAIWLVYFCVTNLNWTWLENPKYQNLMVTGIWNTIWILVVTMVLGMLLAIPIGFAQAVGPWYLARPAQVFCTITLVNLRKLLVNIKSSCKYVELLATFMVKLSLITVLVSIT